MYICIRAYRFALIGFRSLCSPSPLRFLTRYRHTAVRPPLQCVPINFENPKIRHRSKQTFVSGSDRRESDYVWIRRGRVVPIARLFPSSYSTVLYTGNSDFLSFQPSYSHMTFLRTIRRHGTLGTMIDLAVHAVRLS